MNWLALCSSCELCGLLDTATVSSSSADRIHDQGARWTSTRTASAESVTIDRTPDQVYDLLADVSTMGRWSPVCTGGRYDADDAGWFTGDNAIGEYTGRPAVGSSPLTAAASSRS